MPGCAAYEVIDRTRVAVFQFISGDRVLVSFTPNRKPWAYRKRVRIQLGGGYKTEAWVMLVGQVGGPVCALWQDGRIEVLAEGWREGDEWFAEPILRPEEA